MNHLLTLIFFCMTSVGFAQVHWNVNSEGFALDGHDAVGYVRKGVAMDGLNEYIYEYDGVKFKFSRPAYLNEFKKHPEKYLPAFKGWCAYAIAKNGKLVDVNPKTFQVQDNQLLFYYNKLGNNTLEKWNTNSSEMLKQANLNWEKLQQ